MEVLGKKRKAEQSNPKGSGELLQIGLNPSLSVVEVFTRDRIVAEVSASGVETGKLDASIRFLVLDEKAEGSESQEVDPEILRALSNVKGRARDLGLTIIPAWKLKAYLRTIGATLTTPLGSTVRGKDFAPESDIGTRQRSPSNLPEIYRRKIEGMQLDNKILPTQRSLLIFR